MPRPWASSWPSSFAPDSMSALVLVTRSKPERLVAALTDLGLESVVLPLLELVPTHAPPPIVAPSADGALVTSAAVARLAPHAVRWMQSERVVAVGEGTARSLRDVGGRVDTVAEGSGEAALSRFSAAAVPCFVGAARPAPTLFQAVEEGRVVHWPVYDRRAPADLPAKVAALPPVAVVTLASPSAARTWARLGDRSVPCVVIGPTTAQAAEKVGLRVVGQADQPTVDGLARAALAAIPRTVD